MGPTLTPGEAGGALIASVMLAGIAAGRARRRLLLTGVLLGSALTIPWLLDPGHAFWRALMALFATFAVGRTADLLRQEPPAPIGWRVAHLFSLIDMRLLKRARPRVAWRDVLRLTAATCVAHLALHHLPNSGVSRWMLGLIFVYALVESIAAGFSVVLDGLGYRSPPLHADPVLSRSVREFWAERWNRVVSRLLASHIFIPLARRRARGLGLLLSFVVSGLGHGYFTWVAAGPRMAGAMTLFFLFQWPAIALERLWKVDRWPGLAARLWTVSFMLATSPLFVFPALGCVGR